LSSSVPEKKLEVVGRTRVDGSYEKSLHLIPLKSKNIDIRLRVFFGLD
jgi:hypothetical protein